MAGNAKEKGAFALARATSATEVVAAPDYYLPHASGVIVESPITWKRMPNYKPDITHHGFGGFNYTFSASGIEAPVNILGFLLWAILGSDAFSTPNHVITPVDDLPWLNVYNDTMQDLSSDGSNKPVKHAIGAKLTQLKGVFEMGGMAKFDIQGVACDLSTPIAALTPTIDLTADLAPVGWDHIDESTGWIKLGLGGDTSAQDDLLRKLTFEINRAAIMYGKGVGSRQPTKIDHTGREVKIELEKDFFGDDARAQYQEFRSQGVVEVDIKAVVSANSELRLWFPQAVFVDSMEQGTGTDADVVQSKIALEADINVSADPVVTAYVKHAATSDYDTL